MSASSKSNRSNRIGALCLLALIALMLVSNASARPQQTYRHHNLTVDSLNIHYRIAGSGPWLLFLHGFTLTGESWEAIAGEFTDSFTVIIPDLPGHGRSGPFTDTFHYDRAATLIGGLLDSLSIGQVHGIGHSAGAITLLHLAAIRPEQVRSLVLVGGGHRFSVEGRKELIEDDFESLDSATIAFYSDLHPGGPSQIKTIFDQLNGMARDTSWSVFLSEWLGSIDCPVYLIAGDRDRYFPPEIVSELHNALPHRRLWTIPGLGHSPLWEELGGTAETRNVFPDSVKAFWTD